MNRIAESKSLFREALSLSTALGPENEVSLSVRAMYAQELVFDKTRSREDLEEAVKLLEDVHRIARRVLGPTHPHTLGHLGMLKQARFELAYENGKV